LDEIAPGLDEAPIIVEKFSSAGSAWLDLPQRADTGVEGGFPSTAIKVLISAAFSVFSNRAHSTLRTPDQ
jgi:hypothetical protein